METPIQQLPKPVKVSEEKPKLDGMSYSQILQTMQAETPPLNPGDLGPQRQAVSSRMTPLPPAQPVQQQQQPVQQQQPQAAAVNRQYNNQMQQLYQQQQQQMRYQQQMQQQLQQLKNTQQQPTPPPAAPTACSPVRDSALVLVLAMIMGASQNRVYSRLFSSSSSSSAPPSQIKMLGTQAVIMAALFYAVKRFYLK